MNASLYVDTTEGSISRSLAYTVVRRGEDTTTSSNIFIQHSYSQVWQSTHNSVSVITLLCY